MNYGPAKLWLSCLSSKITAMPLAALGRGLKERLLRRVRVAVAGGGRYRAFAMMDTGGVHLLLFRLKVTIVASGVLVLNST